MGSPKERTAAAQILALVQLLRSSPTLRARLLSHFDEISVVENGQYINVDIKLIKELADIADDRYQTDAVRRIRDLQNKPADEYRVFFAPRNTKSPSFCCEVLGVFHRSVAYSQATLNELEQRYNKP